MLMIVIVSIKMCKKNNHTDWVRIPVFTKAISEAPTSESSIQSAIPFLHSKSLQTFRIIKNGNSLAVFNCTQAAENTRNGITILVALVPFGN